MDSISEDSMETDVPPRPAASSHRIWHVGTVPGKLSDALGILVRLAQQSIAILLCPM